MCGRLVIFNEIREHADAVLCTWWLGSEAGNAICNVLWGEYNPSAKLPMTFPAHVGQIPIYYQNKSTGRPTALKQTYKHLISMLPLSLPILSDMGFRTRILDILI